MNQTLPVVVPSHPVLMSLDSPARSDVSNLEDI
jgi:hypothetical protein